MRWMEMMAPVSVMLSRSVKNNLKEIKTSRNVRGYYSRGQLLSISQIYRCLSSYKGIKTAGKTMKKNIESVSSDEFLRVPLEFPVLVLQHVTSYGDAKQILESKSFKGRNHERSEFKDLSFWSADISLEDIEKARLQTYWAMRKVVKAEDMETFHEEIMGQFANSPAFHKSASCYGNFKFSFPLSLLLCRYKTQHCKSGEPQLRILGTDIYKQEMTHYIVIHSPYTEDFSELPPVLSTPTTSNCPQCVSWMDETLYWRPESTSRSLFLRISAKSCTVRNSDLDPQLKSKYKRRPCEPRCVWNHLVLAFHLPNDGELNIPTEYMLKNLTPCEALQPFLKQEDPVLKHKARELIRKLHVKRKVGESSLDSR
ncbi:uncharacterized protein RB166_003131 [Leptodactylus fuscus]